MLGCSSGPGPDSDESQGTVHLKKDGQGYQLIRNGEPFFIKGASGKPHFKELVASGMNTLRVYDTINLQAVLDSAQAYGIAVIVDFPLPKSRYIDSYYDRPKKMDRTIRLFKKIVQRHKNHPALLMWNLGNELDFPYRPHYNPFYQSYNRILEMIHREDPNHPVSTSLTNFQRRTITNIRFKIPDLDLLNINTFGALKTLEEDLESFAWMWDGPYMVSEWGVNGYFEVEYTVWGAPLEDSSWKKAERIEERYQSHMPVDHARFVGSCVFYWGRKQERTETWFNIFTDRGKPNEMYNAMCSVFGKEEAKQEVPPLNYVLIEQEGGKENIILSKGSVYQAKAVFKEKPDSAQFQGRWRITPEDWFSLYLDSVPPVLDLDQLIIDKTDSTLRFKAPPDEGPFRLYYESEYKNGLASTANTPFYVN